jgi:hypothetical protein
LKLDDEHPLAFRPEFKTPVKKGAEVKDSRVGGNQPTVNNICCLSFLREM